MVKSKYISDILDLLLDGDNDFVSARQQLPFITEDNFDYTGGGLFVRFSHSNEIKKYKVDKQDLILNGVKIQTTEYPIEANATLFFTEGLIDFLEIWCYLGDYPNQDLKKYTLSQEWANSPNKIITTEN
ncbi:MAG: hypothetical protein C4K58_07080 [Flavobacteriaceae bacterium]|nr:MAG: hypothetical protein C4K58_07080 [Flavobacteriaceae bacterium]